MAKNDTKAVKRAALRRRVADVFCGAAGAEVDDSGTPHAFIGIEAASRALPALKRLLDYTGPIEPFGVSCLDNYTSIDRAVDFLFEHGVRA